MSQDLGCTLSGLGSARAKSADCPSSRIGFPCRKFVLGARLLGTGSLEFALSGGWQALALLDLRLSASAAFWVEESLSSVAVRDARLVKVPVAAMEERATGTTGAVHLLEERHENFAEEARQTFAQLEESKAECFEREASITAHKEEEQEQTAKKRSMTHEAATPIIQTRDQPAPKKKRTPSILCTSCPFRVWGVG